MLNDMCRFHVGKLQRCAAMQHAARICRTRGTEEKKTKSGSFQHLLRLIRIRGIVRVFNQRVVV